MNRSDGTNGFQRMLQGLGGMFEHPQHGERASACASKFKPFSTLLLSLAGLVVLGSACDIETAEQHGHSTSGHVETEERDLRIDHVPPMVQKRLNMQRVEARMMAETGMAPGEVALDLKLVAKVTSRIEGQVEQVHVQLGDLVRPGQPLVAIGSLTLDELVEQYLVSKAQAVVALDNLRRMKKLRDDKIVTERQIVEARGQHIEAKTRYEHVREKLLNMSLSEEELRELEQGSHTEGHLYTLKAPLAGTVVAQNVVLGQGVSPGDDLLEIVDTSHVWVFASLAIEDARHFHPGEVGAIIPKGGEPVEAPLAYVAPVADEKTRTVQIRFDVSNPTGQLRPHEYVEVRLTRQGSTALAVPLSAVTQVNNRSGVFLQREGGYEFIPLDVGRRSGEWVEITQGLVEGQRVVTEGVFDLKGLLLQETIQGLSD